MSFVYSFGQDKHLKLRFDFTNVTGAIVKDAVAKYPAKFYAPAKIDSIGEWKILDLGNGGYFDMMQGPGTIMSKLEDFTISICYRVDESVSLSGAGHFLWTISQSGANTETSAAYIGYRLNAQKIAMSPNGWGSETGPEIGSESPKGRWIHMLYRQTGTEGELFINGKCVKRGTNMPIPKNIFASAPKYNWLGRPAFSGDNYLKNTLVTDFRIYDIAVSDEVVASLSDVAKQIENEYNYGKVGDFTALKSLVDDSKSVIADGAGTYAPNAVAELQDAISMAELEITANRASQVLIDQLAEQVSSALSHMKSTAGFTPKVKFDYKPGNKGFVHPGALVTQADIDRAKKLIFEDKDDYMVRAWDIICANQYSQSNVATWPTPFVQRGLSGDNYMNAARGAAMA